MGRSQRTKGKVGEREAAAQARDHWHASAARRAQQVDGGLTADLVNALPGAHVEVKRRASIGAVRFMDQAETDRRREEFPVVLMREDGGEWLVVFKMADSSRFAQALAQNFHTKLETE